MHWRPAPEGTPGASGGGGDKGQQHLPRDEGLAHRRTQDVGREEILSRQPASLVVRMIWPVAKRGRPRQRHVPDILSIPAEDMLANAKWRIISWRTGTKGKLKARFAAVRVRVADGPPQRIRDKGQQHLPGDEAWLIGEHRTSAPSIRRQPTRSYGPLPTAWVVRSSESIEI